MPVNANAWTAINASRRTWWRAMVVWWVIFGHTVWRNNSAGACAVKCACWRPLASRTSAAGRKETYLRSSSRATGVVALYWCHCIMRFICLLSCAGARNEPAPSEAGKCGNTGNGFSYLPALWLHGDRCRGFFLPPHDAVRCRGMGSDSMKMTWELRQPVYSISCLGHKSKEIHRIFGPTSKILINIPDSWEPFPFILKLFGQKKYSQEAKVLQKGRNPVQ